MSYFSEANNQYNCKNYDDAIDLYMKAIEDKDNISSSYYNAAVCQIKLKNFGDAIRLIRKALETREESKYYFNLGYCYAMLKDNRNGLINFNIAKRLDPYDKDADKAINEILEQNPELASILKTSDSNIKDTVEIKDCADMLEELKEEELNISVLVKQRKLIKQIDKALDEGDREKFMKLSKKLNNMLDKAKKEYIHR